MGGRGSGLQFPTPTELLLRRPTSYFLEKLPTVLFSLQNSPLGFSLLFLCHSFALPGCIAVCDSICAAAGFYHGNLNTPGSFGVEASPADFSQRPNQPQCFTKTAEHHRVYSAFRRILARETDHLSLESSRFLVSQSSAATMPQNVRNHLNPSLSNCITSADIVTSSLPSPYSDHYACSLTYDDGRQHRCLAEECWRHFGPR